MHTPTYLRTVGCWAAKEHIINSILLVAPGALCTELWLNPPAPTPGGWATIPSVNGYCEDVPGGPTPTPIATRCCEKLGTCDVAALCGKPYDFAILSANVDRPKEDVEAAATLRPFCRSYWAAEWLLSCSFSFKFSARVTLWASLQTELCARLMVLPLIHPTSPPTTPRYAAHKAMWLD